MIIICPNEIKESYLKSKRIHNYKFYTLNEIKEKVFFKYSNLTIYEVSKKYNVKPSIALKMLDSLYYIDSNMKEMFELKEYLISKKLLIKDPNFLNFLHDEINIEGYPKTHELDKIIDILSKYTSVKYIEVKPKYELKSIYSFENIEEEIEFVAENILELIDKGIDINKIVLINYNDEYNGTINKVFSLFKIPFSIKTNKSIIMFSLTKKFLDFIKTSNLKISELNEYIDTLKGENDDILNKIINCLNNYYSLDESVKDLYEIIYFDLKNTYLKEEKYTDLVNIYNGIKVFDDAYYVFYISANEVTKYKDNDYLSDLEKKSLDIDTSYELNQIDCINTLNILSNIKNLYLSFKKCNGDSEYMINHIFEDLEIKNYEFKYNSAKYNEYLFKNYKLYDNSYTKIDFGDLKKYLDNRLNLSYSLMNQFFKCKFRFFLECILKLEPYQDKMDQKVGSMFHKILERTLKNSYNDYLRIIDEESVNYLDSDQKERFYREKLKSEAVKIIERLKETGAKTDFKEFDFEKTLEIPLDSKLELKLKGTVDKILVYNDGTYNHVIVVDYKTGSYDVNLAGIKYGFGMQLLIYLYLINKSKIINNSKIAGAYIDHFLDELKPAQYGKTYDQIEDSRIDGITIKDYEVLKHIDHFYDVKSYIKGIRVKNNGDFYSDSKVYLEKDFNLFLSIVEANIKEVIKSIEECDFEINPKRYYGAKLENIVGCEFCTFKEVCYMSAKDIKMIKKIKLEEMLGDNNELDTNA